MSSWGEQFTRGDQGPNRKIFSANSYSVCPQCNGESIKQDVHCAGCRHNGDGYGTEVFTCNTCGWETSFQYDEADSGSTYYYETKSWNPTNWNFFARSSAAPKPEKFAGNPITDVDRENFGKMKKVAPAEAVRAHMMIKGIRKKDIDAFLA